MSWWNESWVGSLFGLFCWFFSLWRLFHFPTTYCCNCEVSVDSWAHVLRFPTTRSHWRISRLAPPLFPPTHSTLASRFSAHVAPRGWASRTARARASGKRRLDARPECLVGALRRTTTPRSHSIHGRSLWNGWKEIMDWVQWRSQLCSVNHDRRNVSVFDLNKFCKWRSDYEQVVWLCHEHHLLTVVF